MSGLAERRILLGVTGGIAAYKAAELTRLLTGAGAQARVVMTRAAQDFVGALTFQALSGEKVNTDLLDPDAEAAMGHIELARWADLIVIAPASADCIARLAHGHADDLLTTVCLATESPVAIAPAMNQAMWAHRATADNVETLRARGVAILGPASGDQACGETGSGRMREPAALLGDCVELLGPRPLAGQDVLVTAGPTRESLDPVRYLSNHSSGRMGYAIAASAARAGARVTLVSGPVQRPTPAGVERIDVESAREMQTAVEAWIDTADIFIATAAVADYRPAEVAERKIKKGDEDGRTLALARNPDILADACARSPRPYCVGFAAETDTVADNAQAKRQRKGADLICANTVGAGVGFGDVDSTLELFDDRGSVRLSPADKETLARELIAAIAERLQTPTHEQRNEAN
ncbi:MAG: bifunctional phosphopantothenoylcysteine decarboxylase/phosphopantothenate--cysteine ligase CoaBC [Halofilum sp. (in: g-proteobacteria)]